MDENVTTENKILEDFSPVRDILNNLCMHISEHAGHDCGTPEWMKENKSRIKELDDRLEVCGKTPTKDDIRDLLGSFWECGYFQGKGLSKCDFKEWWDRLIKDIDFICGL